MSPELWAEGREVKQEKERKGTRSTLPRFLRIGSRVLCVVLSAGASAWAQGGKLAASSARAGADQSPQKQGRAPAAACVEQNAMVEARQRFDLGIQLYEEGDYSLALIEFNRAHELVPNYRVLYNIAQVSIQLSRYADARRALEEYLRRGGSELDEDRRSAVSADLEMLAGRTAWLMVDSIVPGAEVVVDDAVVGKAPLSGPLLVDAGVHRVVARHPEHEAASSQVTLAGGDERSVTLELVPRRDNPQTIVVRDPISKDNSHQNLMIAGWVTTGALAAGAVVTGIMGAEEKSELQQLRQADAQVVGNLREDLDSTGSSARSLLLASDVFSGAALLVGGLSLWVTLSPGNESSPGKQRPTRIQIGYRRGQLQLRGSF